MSRLSELIGGREDVMSDIERDERDEQGEQGERSENARYRNRNRNDREEQSVEYDVGSDVASVVSDLPKMKRDIKYHLKSFPFRKKKRGFKKKQRRRERERQQESDSEDDQFLSELIESGPDGEAEEGYGAPSESGSMKRARRTFDRVDRELRPRRGGHDRDGRDVYTSLFGEEPVPSEHGPDADDYEDISRLTPAETRTRKEDELTQLEVLRRLGFRSAREYGMGSPLRDIIQEVRRQTKLKIRGDAVKTMKLGYMVLIGILEWVSSIPTFDFMEINLNGWTKSVHGNFAEIEQILGELYDKHKYAFNYGPELKLVVATLKGAYFFSLSKSLDTDEYTEFEQIMRSNPEVQKVYKKALLKRKKKNKSGGPLGNIIKSLITGGDMGNAINTASAQPTPSPVTTPVSHPVLPDPVQTQQPDGTVAAAGVDEERKERDEQFFSRAASDAGSEIEIDDVGGLLEGLDDLEDVHSQSSLSD